MKSSLLERTSLILTIPGNMYVWVSVYDLLPTTHKIREMPFEDRQEAIASILCSCSGTVSMKEYDMSAHGPLAAKASKCTLFRNILCSNQMSRHCCKNEGAEHCRFHSLYPENDESYTVSGHLFFSIFKNVKLIESIYIFQKMENS